MNPATRSGILMFGTYCGLGYIAALLIGWALMAGFLPPHLPSASAAEIAAKFQDPMLIRLGMVVVMYSAMIFMPFGATIVYFLWRIEGGVGVLSLTALLASAATMILTFYPAIWWLVAAFRPERAPELILVFNDLAWLQFIGGVSIYEALLLCITVAAFCDKSDRPVFPRWSGYANIMIFMGFLPGQAIFFFHSGPFSWTGIFGFWIPVVLFCSWFILIFALLRRAVLRERAILIS